MSLTIAKVKQYLEWSKGRSEVHRNAMEREERLMKDAENAAEMWRATLEKMESEQN